MRRPLLLLAMVCGLTSAPAPAAEAFPASANCHQETRTKFTASGTSTYQVLVCTSADPVTPEVNDQDGPTTTVGTSACAGVAVAAGVPKDAYCGGEPKSAATITPALVAAAMRRTEFPASTLIIEPPNGRTLVNLPTNFYTEQEPFTRTLRLLGQAIALRVSPMAFTWHFTDDEQTTTTEPGRPYPKLDITHTYLEKGNASPSVDTTYGADYRVGNGPWQPVPGSVTIPGAAESLEVVEATPKLVG